MRSDSEEEEDKQKQITPSDSVRINESSSQEMPSNPPSTSENDGQADALLSQSEAINNRIKRKSVEILDEYSEKSRPIKGDLSTNDGMRMLSERGESIVLGTSLSYISRRNPYFGTFGMKGNDAISNNFHHRENGGWNPPYRRLRMRANNAMSRFSFRERVLRRDPFFRALRIRDVNAIPLTTSSESSGITEDASPNIGGLRRRRVRNALFISMDREIGIRNLSYRALRIGPQNATLISNDRELGGRWNTRPRILRMRAEIHAWLSRFQYLR